MQADQLRRDAAKSIPPLRDYQSFLASRRQLADGFGFEPNWLPDCLMDFQRALTTWDIRRGRAATFADCGMGKTLLALVRAENVVRHTNRPVLITTPPAVARQFVSEGRKFGVEVTHCRDGKIGGAGVYVTNYDRLHLFDRHDFAATLCDEAGCLKDFDGVRKAEVTEFMREQPYRGLYTAVMAPNDFEELGTASEALGELGYQDMLTRYFRKHLAARGTLGWNVTSHTLRPHAEGEFWRWVCSWARACRKPSDLGFDDGKFVLPPLEVVEHVLQSPPPPGYLFNPGAKGLREQRAELKRTLRQRCEKVAELVNGTGQPAVCWVHGNEEGDLLERLVQGGTQVSGRDSEESKEEKLLAFESGQVRVLVTKPSIAGYGLNWQHCAHQVYFPSHSFEQWYQAVRRCWRFGQTRPVRVDVVTTEAIAGVRANLQRKQDQAEKLFARLVSLMNESLRVHRGTYQGRITEVPSWLSSTN